MPNYVEKLNVQANDKAKEEIEKVEQESDR